MSGALLRDEDINVGPDFLFNLTAEKKNPLTNHFTEI